MSIKTIKYFFLSIFLFLLFNNNVNAARKKLVLAGDYWCPYNCSKDPNYQGFLVDVTRRALHIYGIDIEYRIMPWRKALTGIKKAKIDGIIGISQIKGLNLVTTKFPLEYSVISAFTRNDNDWVYDGSDSLRGKKLGIIMDYDLNEEINNFFGMHYTTNPRIFVVEDGKKAVRDSINNLINGISDVYVEDQRVGEHYIKKYNLSNYIKNAGIISNEHLPLYVAFNAEIPDVKEYVKFLEEGIASLKATGEYEELRVKYKMGLENKG
jgi:polar amino acid transport system substrate-binding protein